MPLPVQVKCSSCDIMFCGADCSNADPKHAACIKTAQYLRYVDTNYIFGTRDYFTLWRESQIVTNSNGDVLFQLSKDETEKMFKLLNLSAFHKRTDADHAQCCDIPYRVIEYGNGQVADMTNVQELASALVGMYRRKTGFYQQSRMRVSSSMK